jgi:ribosomal protein S18 acetylase RimI-like enzyme
MSTSLQPPHEPLPQDPARPTDAYSAADSTVLDNPAWGALTGPHRRLAEIVGAAARYQADVSPFVALCDTDDPSAWTDAARLVGPGNSFVLAMVPGPPGGPRVPEGWTAGRAIPGVQLADAALRGEPDPEAVRLGAADVPEMLDLVERTKPGPFARRTIELGAYYGVRRDGKLVAMAGERMRPPGWTEVSAVCTDPAYRGQGLAARLIRHTVAGIVGRGDAPFLHAAEDNTGAIRLYESLGFSVRRPAVFQFLQVPAGAVEG